MGKRAAVEVFSKRLLDIWFQDPGFSDSIRHVMDGSLPNSLKHIISNAEYYGPSLFLLATDVVTAYVFQVTHLDLIIMSEELLDLGLLRP